MKKFNNQSTFDFEHWCKLAEENPALFEEKRREEIDKVINGAPTATRERLQRLQWRVDMERRRSKNATQACIRIYSMMWKRVYGEHGLLDALNQLMHCDEKAQPEVVEEKAKAEVLRFQVSGS